MHQHNQVSNSSQHLGLVSNLALSKLRLCIFKDRTSTLNITSSQFTQSHYLSAHPLPSHASSPPSLLTFSCPFSSSTSHPLSLLTRLINYWSPLTKSHRGRVTISIMTWFLECTPSRILEYPPYLTLIMMMMMPHTSAGRCHAGSSTGISFLLVVAVTIRVKGGNGDAAITAWIL